MTERSSTSTPDDDRVGAMAEKLGASRQMSLTQAVAYWKDRAEMAERRNLDGELEADTEIAALKDQLQRQQAVIEAAQEWAEHRPNLALEANLAAALGALTAEEPK